MGSSKVARVYTAGGGAKNDKWSTIRSRANGGIPVTASEFAEASYGAAREDGALRTTHVQLRRARVPGRFLEVSRSPLDSS